MPIVAAQRTVHSVLRMPSILVSPMYSGYSVGKLLAVTLKR